MKTNYYPVVNTFATETTFKLYDSLIRQAICQFKTFYSRFDKRLLTTSKKANVSIKLPLINVSIDFNKVHYSQCYMIENGKLENIRITY